MKMRNEATKTAAKVSRRAETSDSFSAMLSFNDKKLTHLVGVIVLSQQNINI